MIMKWLLGVWKITDDTAEVDHPKSTPLWNVGDVVSPNEVFMIKVQPLTIALALDGKCVWVGNSKEFRELVRRGLAQNFDS